MRIILKDERGDGCAEILISCLIILIILFVLWMICSLAQGAIESSNTYQIEGRIVRTDIFRDGDSDIYEASILTKNGDIETFQNRDALNLGKTNSADWQTRLKLGIGKCYRFTLVGWRSSLLSMFPNMVGMTEISCQGFPTAPE